MQSWKTKQLMHEGLPLLLRYPERFDRASFRTRFSDLVVVTHRFSKVNPNGLPDPDYNDSLMDIDQAVRKAFESADLGIVVLVETFAGKRNYYFYCTADVDVAKALSSLARNWPQEKVSWSVHPDPAWGFIERYSKEFLEDGPEKLFDDSKDQKENSGGEQRGTE